MAVTDNADDLVASITEARRWLMELSEATVRHKPTPDRWSIAEVIGHLVDSAANNHQRFIRAQETGALTFPKYEQQNWARLNNYQDSNWSSLIELWYSYNLHLAHVMRQIPEEQLQISCTITPNDPCTLEFLLTDYVDHLNHHLAKIQERLG